jgi:exodeoxyribonuclease V beta subunit
VRGYLDLYFELEGRGFIVDWKSDRLARYDAPTMREHVDRRYALQSEVYALGAARMLGVTSRQDYEARFGGFAFAFIRAAGKGDWVDFRRPTWDQVLECEAWIARGEAR